MASLKQTINSGISAAQVLSIPKEWSPEWFRSFITNFLQAGDIRNATTGPGITITPGTLGPNGSVNISANPTISVTPSTFAQIGAFSLNEDAEEGPQGAPGQQGIQGIQGQQGIPGVDGEPGEDGQTLPVVLQGRPTITGSRGGNVALASLLTALASLNLIIDSTTA